MVVLYPHTNIVATYPPNEASRACGRRGLRPSRDTWRWRPRHRICQPPSRNQSISAQRTTTGASSLRQILKCNRKSQIENRKFSTTNYPPPSTSLHFYTAKAISHDGEGAVATYGRSQQVRPSRVDLRSQWTATLPRNARRRGRRRYGTIHYPTTNYQLNRKIVNSQLPTIIYQLPSTSLHFYTAIL